VNAIGTSNRDLVDKAFGSDFIVRSKLTEKWIRISQNLLNTINRVQEIADVNVLSYSNNKFKFELQF
jgi:hypothetical protein